MDYGTDVFFDQTFVTSIKYFTSFRKAPESIENPIKWIKIACNL